jgi:hypothetical protein
MKNTQLIYILIAILYVSIGYILYKQFKRENYMARDEESNPSGNQSSNK